MVQVKIKNIENEIVVLDKSLDSKLKLNKTQASSFAFTKSSLVSASNTTSSDSWDIIKAQKEQALDEAKRAHEDLEFQLMELEAKYETELEDIQSRLINERDNLLQAFKARQVSLDQYEIQQSKMLSEVKVNIKLNLIH